MTSETETLVDFLSSKHAEKGRLFSSPETEAYLARISNLSLPELLEEPNTLAAEGSQLTNSLTNLCHAEYPTFLALHNTSSLFASTFDAFDTSLQSLLEAIPRLENQAKEFTESTKSVQSERKKAGLVLEHHDKLLAVLEIPQLIDTCIRNSYYQEAMDLAAHTSALSARFPDLPIVQDIAAEVEHATRQMLAQLLGVLREPAKLPALFKAVSFLRRTRELDEPTLALAFLTSRILVLDTALAALRPDRQTTPDPARYARRYLDTWREGVYDLVTQYTTIFLERPADPSPTAVAAQHRLLTTAARALLDRLLAELHAVLPRVGAADFAGLATLLTQLTYCATSFGRIGLDFRLLLVPAFEDAVRTAMRGHFDAAGAAFARAVPRGAWGGVSADAVVNVKLDTAQPPHMPPQILATCAPLAVYTNALLTHLNGLRLLAPKRLLPVLLDYLDASLAASASALLVYAKTKGDAVKPAGKLLLVVFVPFIRRALVEGVYNGKVRDRPVKAGEELAAALRDWRGWLGLPEAAEEASGMAVNGDT